MFLLCSSVRIVGVKCVLQTLALLIFALYEALCKHLVPGKKERHLRY